MSRSRLTKSDKARPLLGWREWVSLPDLKVKKIKVKVDTGARTSALHVSDLKLYKKGRMEYAEFKIHPMQKKIKPSIKATAKVVEHRSVRSSNGQITVRPVIETTLVVGEKRFLMELTLVNRDLMGFRMLLGRLALKDFVIHPGKSFLQSEQK